MKISRFLTLCFVGVFVLGISAMFASAEELWPEKWWPSKWGAGDEKGSFNTVTPKNVLAALKTAKTGKIYRLGRPYTSDMPKFGSRTYSLHIPGLPSGGPFGTNQVVWNDEFVVAEIGQVGTQFDGPGHIGVRGKDGVDRWYNGAELASSENTYGLKKNGVEKVGPCIARGVLIDLVGLKGKAMNQGEVITVADVEACIKKAGIAPISEGNAVLFHTGWGQYYNTDKAKYNAGEPGIGIEVARYVADKNVSILCADTWAVDVIPGENKDFAFEIHNFNQTVNGIWYIENLNNEVMAQMAKDGVYEFLFIFVPVPLAGATGSPGDVVAVQ
jgi:kynurenine formamidase